MTKEVDNFNPGIAHRLYLIRKALYNAIQHRAGALSGKMMDFGCGEKPYKNLFAHVGEYVGVDYAGEGHDHTDEEIDFFYDGKTIPFPDNTFDSVLSTEVFEHIFNLTEILEEIHRVMKPGAKLLFTCPFVWPLHEKPIDFARYTPFALRHMLEKAGFRVLSMDKSGNPAEALGVLKIDMGLNKIWYNKFTRAIYVGKALNRAFILYTNIKAVIKTKLGLYNKDGDFYLNNIVLVEKV